MEVLEVSQKPIFRVGNKDLLHKLANCLIVSLVWVNPACVDFGFLDGLQHVGPDALPKIGKLLGGGQFSGPGTDQRLVKQIFIVAVRRKLAIHC